MHTIETRYPDGTRARYTLAPGSTVPLQLAALKPLRTRWARSEKRLFPKWNPAMSTADYVRAYFKANTGGTGGGICRRLTAYENSTWKDHLALYAPLPDRPAPFYTGVDGVETIEGDAE
jgi:hypothetical protein